MDLTIDRSMTMHKALRPSFGDEFIWGALARRIKLGCVSYAEAVPIVFRDVPEARLQAREVRRCLASQLGVGFTAMAEHGFVRAIAKLDDWLDTPVVDRIAVLGRKKS